MVAVDRIQGLSGSRAIKTPVRVATAGAIALSGEQTVDGVAVVEGDRVLVKDQASGVDNGIYEVSTGDWARTLDFDGANDVTQGTLLTVNAGTISAGMIYKLTTADPITIGATSLSFSGSGIAPTLPLAINQGGTGSSTASDARTALGAAASGANTDITSLAGVTLGAAGLSSTVAMTADISPSQITANQNDYNPTGLSTASVLRLNTDASRDITGLQGGADGRLIVITNVGSFAMVLKDESGSSTAANRFALAADITLATDQSVVLQYDSTSSRWRALSIPLASSSASVVGSVRNGKMSVTSASATGTYTADEIIVETALGGTPKQLSSYSQAINLGTTGAGGMDTGAAPASGFVSLYAIAKEDGTKSILACNVTTSSAEIYGGGNMPSGYSYSALVGIWPTNGSSQFVAGILMDRRLSFVPVNIFTATTGVTSWTSQSISAAVPAAAKTVSGIMGDVTNTNPQIGVAANSSGMGAQISANYGAAITAWQNFMHAATFHNLPIITAQTLYWQTQVATASAYRIDINGYTF